MLGGALQFQQEPGGRFRNSPPFLSDHLVCAQQESGRDSVASTSPAGRCRPCPLRDWSPHWSARKAAPGQHTLRSCFSA